VITDYLRYNARRETSRSLRIRRAHDIRGPRYERIISPAGDAIRMQTSEIRTRVRQARALHMAATCGEPVISNHPESFVAGFLQYARRHLLTEVQ
jgi:hypothetical protein